MTHGFAAEFEFEKIGGDVLYIDGRLVCDHWAVSNTTDMTHEVFNPLVMEDPRTKSLEDGYYHCYVVGEVQFQETENHDTWSRDSEYVFTAEEKDVSFHRLGKVIQGNGE